MEKNIIKLLKIYLIAKWSLLEQESKKQKYFLFTTDELKQKMLEMIIALPEMTLNHFLNSARQMTKDNIFRLNFIPGTSILCRDLLVHGKIIYDIMPVASIEEDLNINYYLKFKEGNTLSSLVEMIKWNIYETQDIPREEKAKMSHLSVIQKADLAKINFLSI